MSAINIINAKVDLAQGVQMVRLGRLFAANDKAAHTINVRVLNDGAVADLTGQTISAYFIRPDNATVTVQGTLSGNVASITLPSSCYANSGHFSLIIKAVSTNVTTAIFWGDGTITRSTTDTIVDPENVIPSLEELLAQIAVMEQGTAAANAAATSANSAASAANTAATAADTAATAIQTLTVEASNLTPGSTATATVSTVDSHKHIAFGIPIGHTPNLTIGTVQTLSEESSATATITGTQTAPVLNLGIPRGRTGSAENVFASNVPMSSTDSTTIATKISTVESNVAANASDITDITSDITDIQTDIGGLQTDVTGLETIPVSFSVQAGSSYWTSGQAWDATVSTMMSGTCSQHSFTLAESAEGYRFVATLVTGNASQLVVVPEDGAILLQTEVEPTATIVVQGYLKKEATRQATIVAAEMKYADKWYHYYAQVAPLRTFGAFQTSYWAQTMVLNFSPEITWVNTIVTATAQNSFCTTNAEPVSNSQAKVNVFNLGASAQTVYFVRVHVMTKIPTTITLTAT